jgi:hypothetical protein
MGFTPSVIFCVGEYASDIQLLSIEMDCADDSKIVSGYIEDDEWGHVIGSIEGLLD